MIVKSNLKGKCKMKNKLYIFRDLQSGGFSRHTSIDGLAEMCFDDMLRCAENEKDEQSIINEYGNSDEVKSRQLIYEYDFEILDPTSDNIAEWEEYHKSVFGN
jgi:hypothetical protein